MQYQNAWLERGEGRVTYTHTVEIRGRPYHLRLTAGYYDSTSDLKLVNELFKDTAYKLKLSIFAEFKLYI